MSYLQGPRIHFKGRFRADTSTVNNDVRHYEAKYFEESFQQMMEICDDSIHKYNGYWNPDGSAAWQMIDCRVTSAVLDGKRFSLTEEDAAVGAVIGGANDKVAGKLVDLDPQQQMVSQIWGLTIRLQDVKNREFFSSEFEPAPFADLWLRQQEATEWFDQQLAAAYQSRLTDVVWAEISDSPTLSAMRQRSDDGLLSIRMNVFGYDRTPSASDYGTGVVVGTIGLATRRSPKLFVLGRHLTPPYKPPSNTAPPSMVPVYGIGPIQALVNEDQTEITADFGHAIQVVNSSGALAPPSSDGTHNAASYEFGILKEDNPVPGDTLSPDEVIILGLLPAAGTGWFETAGIHTFSLSEEAQNLIGQRPLAVVLPQPNGRKMVLSREASGGVFLRADYFVFRLNPAEEAQVDLWASRFGIGIASQVSLKPNAALLGGAGTGAELDPKKFPVPDVATPADGIAFPTQLGTSHNGCGTFTITASSKGPGNPRGYIDGQVYGIGYEFAGGGGGTAVNMQYFVSILAWDDYTIPEQPTWHEHVKPILQQYANLYPIMSRGLFDLGDYESVVKHLKIMELCFALPVSNPNSMPVTRDLSENKRQMILKWLRSKAPETNLPPLGESPTILHETSASTAAEAPTDQKLAESGKVEFARLAVKTKKLA